MTMVIDLTTEEFAAIGKIAAASAHLDFQIGALLADFMGLGVKQGRAVFINMDTRPKIEMLRAAAAKQNLPECAVQELVSICDDADDLREHRRRLIHGFWARTPDKELVVVQYFGAGKDRANAYLGTPYRANGAGIMHYANKTVEAVNRLVRWRLAHGSPASQEIPPQPIQTDYQTQDHTQPTGANLP